MLVETFTRTDGIGAIISVSKNMLTRITADDPWSASARLYPRMTRFTELCVQPTPFTNVYDAATNLYPYRTEQTKIDPRNIDCGDTVIVEGRIVCKDRALPGWKGDMELLNLYLVEKVQTKMLMNSLAP